MFTQENGLEIAEGKTYKSHVGDIIRITKINLKNDQMKVYNVSESCNSWHSVKAAIKDNKFKTEL